MVNEIKKKLVDGEFPYKGIERSWRRCRPLLLLVRFPYKGIERLNAVSLCAITLKEWFPYKGIERTYNVRGIDDYGRPMVPI